MNFFKKRISHLSENPYVQENLGQRIWNYNYNNLIKSRLVWQFAFFLTIVLLIIETIFLGKLSLRSSIQPFVVETNQGLPYALKTVQAVSANDLRIINYALNQFIINSRTVVNDAEAQKTILSKVYAFSAGKSKLFLRDYFNSHDPFKLGYQYKVTVQIINSLPISKNTWQITWDETKKDLTSNLYNVKTRWLAQLHYEFGKVNPQFEIDNPFGIYITDLTWSESQIHE